ncbi:energy transducer TonB [Pyxidicoccus parkwayensis]|uniref:Energy transducer TonB n=1 Tax=Pyxidicoccus parkwayensis TaxID=2813578 RepID=A0ABX7P4T9_9BACT|nr:M56 family metallopeptidase [Pyxidicoccus parkwaysis]QSQ25456.1 energy transducer TonB [Pyxidicoccus parkwaysis]
MLSQQPVFLALERALIDFLWQGAAVALVVAAVMAAIPERASRGRYATACLGLLAMAVLPVITFLTTLAEASRFTISAGPTAGASASSSSPLSVNATFTVLSGGPPVAETPWLETLRPWLLSAWCLGVLLLSSRTVLAWVMTQRLSRRSTHEAAKPWKDALEKALTRMRMSGPVRLLASASIDVPMVIGLWRPLILVPASAMTGLSASQLEAILAHELAHIRRHDYLVNLLQSLVETLLFYHPAVWWLSHRIREEREHCADDLAVQSCGDAYLYARALAHIEQLRLTPSPQPALGAAGGSLLTRVRRLLSASESHVQRRPWRLASGVGSAVLAVVLGTSQLPDSARAEPPPSPKPSASLARLEEAHVLAASAPMQRPLVAPTFVPPPSPAPVRAPRPSTRSLPKEERAPAAPVVKSRSPRSAPLLIPDTQSIARTELPRAPYSLDAEPAAEEPSAPVQLGAPMAEEPSEAFAVIVAPPAEKSQHSVLEMGPGITPPRFLSGDRFHYPSLTYGIRSAMSSFPSGSVVARCTITTEGTVIDCKSLQGLGGLEENVIRTLSTWRYEPAMLNGRPVAVHYVFDIVFSTRPGGERLDPPARQMASLGPELETHRGATATPATGG